MKYEDTLMDPKLRRLWVERLSQMSVADHLRRHNSSLECALTLCRAGVRMQYPEWDEAQVEHEVARRADHLDPRASFTLYMRYIAELVVEVLDRPNQTEARG